MLFPEFIRKYDEWFDFDYQKAEYVPKDGTPQEALDMYQQYLDTQEKMKKNGLRA